MLDNFDSFTYNLVDFFKQLGCQVHVYRNTVAPELLETIPFDLLVLSPGPSLPRNAGNMMGIIAHFYQKKPILGVCLGHQALIEFFGGTLANVAPVHGKSAAIHHDGRGVFTGLEPNCEVARYHSWAGDFIPAELEVTARAADGVIMAVRHKQLPIEGIQFHPESVLSMKNKTGMRMLKNVVEGRMASGNRIFHELSNRLQTGADIPGEALRAFIRAILEEQLSDDQKQILLVSLSHRLRNAPELAHFMAILREFQAFSVVSPPADLAADLVDVCGTGGSGLPRINTSTLASLLLADAGLPIAKHGNRAAAGRFGSFNLLESIGVPAHFDPIQADKTLQACRLAFIFAPDIHPVFKYFAPTRAKMGVPTVFNALGPLLNPYQPKRQFIGTAFADLMDVIVETGIQMGKEHLIVVRGADGLDEISLSGPTRVLEYKAGQKQEYWLHPSDFGLESLPFSAFSAANPIECQRIAQDMMRGKTDSAHHQLVAANAAFIYTKFVSNRPLPEVYQQMVARIQAGAMQCVVAHYQSVMSEKKAMA